MAPRPEEAVAPETIRTAAILYHNCIYRGIIHSDALEALRRDHPHAQASEFVEGFETTYGRFLDRTEAKKMAAEQDLLRPSRSAYLCNDLWSEHLVYGTLQP